MLLQVGKLQVPKTEILEPGNGTGIAISAIVGSIKLLDPDPEVRAAAVQLDRARLELAQQLGAMGVIEVPIFGPCSCKRESLHP